MKQNEPRTPFHRKEDDEFLGYIAKDETSWQAQTIFGYIIARTETRRDAENVLLEKGLGYLLGTWQYFDAAERDWFPCVIQEAYEHKVIVIRTNEFGYEDPDDYKRVILEDPDENTLIKSS